MIGEKYADYMYKLVDKVITEIGPRESCGEQEKKLGRLMVTELKPGCDRVDVETFKCSPKAFLGAFPFLVVGYVAAVILYYIYSYASLILTLLCVTVLFYEVIRYRELIDFLFPRREGINIAGIIRPKGDVNKRVIVSAHMDSAYEFKIWYWFKGFAVALMAAAFLSVLVLLGASLARTIAGSNGVPHNTAFSVLGIICIALSIFVLPFAFFHTKDVVPGAMDNMAGISVVAGLGRYLYDARESGEYAPENTEVVLLCLSSEEAGLRGAKRYASRHDKELKELPTFGIFLDCIYDENYLIVNKREVWTGAKLDPYLVKLASETAESNGFKIKETIVPVGATDASAFALAKIPAVSMLCQDTSRLVPHYHTRLDTIEHVRPQSLAVSLQMVIDMLKRIDQNQQIQPRSSRGL
jgi:Peptidase family M28